MSSTLVFDYRTDLFYGRTNPYSLFTEFEENFLIHWMIWISQKLVENSVKSNVLNLSDLGHGECGNS